MVSYVIASYISLWKLIDEVIILVQHQKRSIKKMSEIALYNALTKLGLPPDEAKEAVADVASSKDVATKDYIDAVIAKQDARLTWRLVIAIGIYTAIITFIIKIL